MPNEATSGELATDLAGVPEILGSRAPFYRPASLGELPVLCGDDRTQEACIQMFGGGLNVVYNLSVLQEMNVPGTVTGTFEAQTRRIMPVLQEVARINPGVHSDTTTEQGQHMRFDEPGGAVGCGYAHQRRGISRYIVDNRSNIVADAAACRPDLFTSPGDEARAKAVIGAHRRLVQLPGFITSGREAVMAAIDKGAAVAIVNGDHTAGDGIINYIQDSRFDGASAIAASLPAYNHDGWAFSQTMDRIGHLYPYGEHQREIAGLIDTIGTMRALGVENIAVRF